MTDYSKLKVTDLKELLSQRELPTTGKKDELIARLISDDAAKASKIANGENPPEIVQDTPAVPAATSAPSQPVEKKQVKDTTATSKASTSESAASVPVEGEKKKFTFKRLADEFENPATKEPAEAKPEESKPVEPAEPAESFAAGLASTNADSELEKRKKRAARFGVPVSESIKLAERVKRFAGAEGEDSSKDKAMKALDSALGENRGKKRAPDTRIQNEPPKKSKDNPKPVVSSSSKGILSDPNEKAKAEARAKRFG